MNSVFFRSSLAFMAFFFFAYCGTAASLDSILCDSDDEDIALAPFSFGEAKDLRQTSTPSSAREDIGEQAGQKRQEASSTRGKRAKKRRKLSYFGDDNNNNACGACAEHDESRSFTSKQELWEHVFEKHIETCKGRCPWQGCDYAQSLFNITALKHHVDSEHVGYGHLECAHKCGMRFSWPSNLVAHEKTCGPNARAETLHNFRLEGGRKKKSDNQQAIISAWRCPDCRLVVEKNSSEHRFHGNSCTMKKQASTEKAAKAGALGRTQQSNNGQSAENHQGGNRLISVPIIIDITKESSSSPLNFYCPMDDKMLSCQKVFSTKTELLDHIKKAHYLSCGWPDCGYGPFDDTEALLRHIIDYHQASE